MTTTQIKAAHKMLKTLERARLLVESTGDVRYVILEEVKAKALASNAECQQLIRQRLELHEKLAARNA